MPANDPTRLEAHPAAGLFPLLPADELEALAADIAAEGLHEPIVLLDGQILDGRNRYAACLLAGVEPSFTAFPGGDPVRWVVSLNLHRRHLNESQRAMVASRLATRGRGQPGNAPIGAFTQGDAADLLNTSRRAVQRARVVGDRAVPEVVSAVEAGDLAVSRAAQIAKLPPAEQVAAIPHVARNSGNNEWYTPAFILDAARACLGGIDTDPASSPEANRTVRASTIYTAEDDGLRQEWRGRVWCNPPYAQPLMGEFAEAIASKYESGEYDAAIVLVNNATETVWFQRILNIASAVCFPAGRVKFYKPGGSTGAPLQGQALLYLGPEPDSFAEAFDGFGCVLR